MNAKLPQRCSLLALALLFALSLIGGPCQAFASDADSAKTPADVFEGMKKGFKPDKAKDVHAKYQFKVSGPNGGDWWFNVQDGKCEMGRGTIDSPDVTLSVSDDDWVAISNGKLKGSWAYMTGRLKIAGSQSLARKMDDFFP